MKTTENVVFLPTAGEVMATFFRLRRLAASNWTKTKYAIRLRRQYERNLLRIEGVPFTRMRQEELREAIKSCDAMLATLREFRLKAYRVLRPFLDEADRILSFEQKCDMLNVNTADRVGIDRNEKLVHIIFSHGLENSASRRWQDFNDAPLYNVMMSGFAEFMSTPAGSQLADDAFRSGGFFDQVMAEKREKEQAERRSRLRVVK